MDGFSQVGSVYDAAGAEFCNEPVASGEESTSELGAVGGSAVTGCGSPAGGSISAPLGSDVPAISVFGAVSTELSRFAAMRSPPAAIRITLEPIKSERMRWERLLPGLSSDPCAAAARKSAVVGSAAAALAARRAAAMKFDVLLGSEEPDPVGPSAASEAAIRSAGEAVRPPCGLKPGSMG